MLNKNILISIVLLCIACHSNTPQEQSLHKKIDSSMSNIPDTNSINQQMKSQDKNKGLNEDDEIIAEKDNFKILYNQNSRNVKLLFNDSTHVMGQFFNTFGYAPNIEFIDIGKNKGIVIVSVVEQLGMVEYQLTLFELNNQKNILYKQCSFSNIATHNTEIDTLQNIKHYDYSVQGRKFVIKEYYPYKSLKDSLTYSTKSKSCTLHDMQNTQ